jgi:hypothetical protein
MTNDWTTNSDGSVTFDGSITFPAGFNSTTGAGIVIFGPNGGTTNFGAIATGPPGLAPTMTFTTVQVASGTALPTTNPAVVFTPASGSTPPNYAVTNYVNAGATGAAGGTEILTATDIEGTAAQGSFIGYSTADAKAQWQPEPCGGYFFTNTFSATSSTTVAVKPITSITISAQLRDWWPEVSGQFNVIGAVDTRIDAVARVNNATSGTICGYGLGQAGSSAPPPVLQPYGLSSGNNVISAGSAATIYFNAENQTSSSNPWNTTAGGVSAGYFSVKVAPVPA